MKHIKAHKKSITVSLGVLVSVVICFAVLVGGNLLALGNEASLDDKFAVVEKTSAGDENIAAEKPVDDSVETCYISAYIPPMTQDELLEQANLIIYGRVTQKELIFIQSIHGGDPCGHTDYYFEPISVLRGEPVNKDEVIVRVMTGEDKDRNVKVVLDYMKDLNIGDEYLLFLGKTELGGEYNTKGDWYYILGTNQGIFEVSKENKRSAAGDLIPEKSSALFNEIELDYESFDSEIKKANIETPVDPDLDKKTAYDALESNLKSGFISEEEYELYKQDLEKYAVIVK